MSGRVILKTQKLKRRSDHKSFIVKDWTVGIMEDPDTG